MEQHAYYVIKNADGKCWLIPEKAIRLGIQIYQPSTVRGKLLKHFLPMLKMASPLTKYFGICKLKLQLYHSIQEFVLGFLGVGDYDYSIFCGTPGKHQKSTVQISQGGDIIAYLKLSDKQEIADIFAYESRFLKQWNNLHCIQTPNCLYYGEIPHSTLVGFLQTTKKRLNSKSPQRLTNKIKSCMEQFCIQTQKTVLYEETNFAHDISQFSLAIPLLPPKYASIVTIAIDLIKSRWEGQTTIFCGYHGDFTPWNCFWIDNRNLFLFDLEYARESYPPLLDLFHFFFQNNLLVKANSVNKAFKEFSENKIFASVNDRYFYAICYLISILSLYYFRDGVGTLESDHINRSRLELLDRILNEYNIVSGSCWRGKQ